VLIPMTEMGLTMRMMRMMMMMESIMEIAAVVMVSVSLPNSAYLTIMRMILVVWKKKMIKMMMKMMKKMVMRIE